MDIDFDFKKIKRIPWFIAENSFWSVLVVIAIAVLLGMLFGYRYVYLVKQINPEAPELTHLNQKKLQEVLDILEEREQKFKETAPPSYNLFESD
ncbi:MAG: hypothetical protein V5A57_02105 [Candidatus Paceibacterota bacterium]